MKRRRRCIGFSKGLIQIESYLLIVITEGDIFFDSWFIFKDDILLAPKVPLGQPPKLQYISVHLKSMDVFLAILAVKTVTKVLKINV